jgi:hypothetical protein
MARQIRPISGNIPADSQRLIADKLNEVVEMLNLMLREDREMANDISGKAASSHTHAGADIDSGTLPDARIQATGVTQHVGSIDHDSLLNHVAGQHRIINDSGTSATELWSASKINGLALGATAFTGLSDTPGSYSGDGSKIVIVASGETALEFSSIRAASDTFVMTEKASGPSTPSTGDWALYFKAGGLYFKDDAGTESQVQTV